MTDGTGARDQAALVRALLEARERGDAALTAEAARRLPRGQRFGAYPGQLPALLRAEYDKAADPLSRCRLAAALARAWVYGGYPERSRDFADEALRLSAVVADPAAAVDALDAMLLASWGPDALSDRLRLAARIEEAAAYADDPEARLSAHLWRLTTAWECLDVVAVQRQLRALDTLAQETGSPRAAFFAASRRAMHALVTAELAVADDLIAQALAAYRQRLRDLETELDEARSWADEGRTARLALEREALLSELRAAAGLGGRPRRFSAADERARVAVRKAIAAALTRIEGRDPALARLLKDTVRTGALPLRPGPGPPGVLDPADRRLHARITARGGPEAAARRGTAPFAGPGPPGAGEEPACPAVTPRPASAGPAWLRRGPSSRLAGAVRP